MILARVRFNGLLRTGEPYEPRSQDHVLTGLFFSAADDGWFERAEGLAAAPHERVQRAGRRKMTDHRMRSSASLQPELDPSWKALSGLMAEASLAQAARIHYEFRQDLGRDVAEWAVQIG
jgi:hypothetical protein